MQIIKEKIIIVGPLCLFSVYIVFLVHYNITIRKGREVYELMKMGAIDGLSVGYRVDAKGYDYDKRKKYRRLKEVDLMEISAVTFPMNPRARISAVKSDFTVREWEKKLREVGNLSHSEAKVAASAVQKALGQREVEKDPDLLSKLNALTEIFKK